jgi:hypothetical protein
MSKIMMSVAGAALLAAASLPATASAEQAQGKTAKPADAKIALTDVSAQRRGHHHYRGHRHYRPYAHYRPHYRGYYRPYYRPYNYGYYPYGGGYYAPYAYARPFPFGVWPFF